MVSIPCPFDSENLRLGATPLTPSVAGARERPNGAAAQAFLSGGERRRAPASALRGTLKPLAVGPTSCALTSPVVVMGQLGSGTGAGPIE